MFLNFLQAQVKELPFTPLLAPKYRAWKHKSWRLSQKEHPKFLRGYFLGLQAWPGPWPNWVLTRGKTIWMSLTPMELESQGHHLLAARGCVLVMGCGMGALVYNLMQKREVESIVVVDREPEILRMIRELAESERWPGRTKAVWVTENALEYKTRCHFDTALVDIWPSVGDTAIRPDMQRIARNVSAREYAAWSGELDFVSWCQDRNLEPHRIGQTNWIHYSQDIGIPLIHRDKPWMARLALAAAYNVILY
jgi:hypothetical protein